MWGLETLCGLYKRPPSVSYSVVEWDRSRSVELETKEVKHVHLRTLNTMWTYARPHSVVFLVLRNRMKECGSEKFKIMYMYMGT